MTVPRCPAIWSPALRGAIKTFSNRRNRAGGRLASCMSGREVGFRVRGASNDGCDTWSSLFIPLARGRGERGYLHGSWRTSPLVLDLTPRLPEAPGCGQPKTSRNRLPPSQGMATSVVSNPAAISNGLCARFWNLTSTSRSVIMISAVASIRSMKRCRDLTAS